MKTQLELLDERLKQRDCQHVWKVIGHSIYKDLWLVDYKCIHCKKEKSETL